MTLSSVKPQNHKLHKRVLELSRREMLWQSGDKIIIGVSGGGDSMCLLYVLKALSDKEGFEVIVGHVNYRIRGKHADRDQAHVENTCQRLGVICETLTLTENLEKKSENHLRSIRRNFLFGLMEKYGANKIALGHTINDRSESLLLNLVRGTGLRGLVNMRVRDGAIIRPLLTTTATETRSYCRNIGVRYYNDYTNNLSTYTRNKVRHKLIPLIERYFNKKASHTLQQTAELLSDVEIVLKKRLAADTPFEITKSHENLWFYAADFLKSSPEERRLTLFYLFRDLGVSTLTHKVIRDVEFMIMQNKRKRSVYKHKNLIVERKSAKVEITLES